MHRKGCRLAVVSLAVLTLAPNLYAQDPPPAGASQNTDAASSSQTVSAEDYRALKREVDELKKRVDSQDKQPVATTRPVAGPIATKVAGGLKVVHHRFPFPRAATLFGQPRRSSLRARRRSIFRRLTS